MLTEFIARRGGEGKEKNNGDRKIIENSQGRRRGFSFKNRYVCSTRNTDNNEQDEGRAKFRSRYIHLPV